MGDGVTRYTPRRLNAAPAAAVTPRRLAAVGGRHGLQGLAPSSNVHGPTPAGIALLSSLAIGVLLFGFLRKFGGPLSTLSRDTLRYTGRLPLSWHWFYYRLPKIDESKFPELRNLLKHRRDRRRNITQVKNVSKPLADFLNLSDRVRQTGIVVKTKAFEQLNGRKSAYEASVHWKIVPHNTFLLRLIGVYRGSMSSNVYLIMPRMRGDVSQLLTAMPESINLRLMAAEMAYAVYVLHRQGFVHRDIKPQNFLVAFDGHVLLADFEGFGVQFFETLILGTTGYRAPEVRQMHQHTPASDIYSLGKTFLRMQESLEDTSPPDNDKLSDLIGKMTSYKVQMRPTIEEVLEHPYFHPIDFNSIERKQQGTPVSSEVVSSETPAADASPPP